MNTNTTPNRIRIFEHMTKTRFLHIEDSLEIGKLRLFIGDYVKGQGAKSTAYAFIDVDDARVVLSDMAAGKPLDWADFKGGKNGGGAIVSRVTKIKTKADDKTGELKYWIQVENGPGQLIGEGAVKPAGKPTAQIPISFTTFEARKLAHACLAYMQAWQTAHLLNRAHQAQAEEEWQPA